jgi:serine/threonine protein kinase
MDQMLGHCRVVAKIGEGGMGVFYRAYDEISHCDVAVKVANKDARLDSSASQRLFQEALLLLLLASSHARTAFPREGYPKTVDHGLEGRSFQTESDGCAGNITFGFVQNMSNVLAFRAF